jgi:nitroimidazol reductase NimA-like FMN-containing flavoprotein (pyridoxamine 5'-phosphate oxidase superfamily)
MRYHIRRKEKEFTDQGSMVKVLKSQNYITLAMVDDGEPYMVPLSHALDEERNRIYIHMASEGRKLSVLRKNPSVWGQALQDHGYHKGECSHLYASVMFKGKVVFIDDVDEKKHAFRVMADHLEPDLEARERFATSNGIPGTVVAYIDIDDWSGKKSSEVTI